MMLRPCFASDSGHCSHQSLASVSKYCGHQGYVTDPKLLGRSPTVRGALGTEGQTNIGSHLLPQYKRSSHGEVSGRASNARHGNGTPREGFDLPQNAPAGRQTTRASNTAMSFCGKSPYLVGINVRSDAAFVVSATRVWALGTGIFKLKAVSKTMSSSTLKRTGPHVGIQLCVPIPGLKACPRPGYRCIEATGVPRPAHCC